MIRTSANQFFFEEGSEISDDRYGSALNSEFDNLLAAINPDREKAGTGYLRIRSRLASYFVHWFGDMGESFSDEVLDRAAKKVCGGAAIPDIERYCIGIARNVVLEKRRELKTRAESQMLWARESTTSDLADTELLLSQLDQALSKLPELDRELVLAYYSCGRDDSFRNRGVLALRFGLSTNALRVRAHRTRSKLKTYLSKRPAFAARIENSN